MKRLTWITTFALMTLLPAGLTLACPMCKDSIPTTDAQTASSVPLGFNVSIYSMFMGLFLTLGFVSSVIVKGVRNADAAQMNELKRKE